MMRTMLGLSFLGCEVLFAQDNKLTPPIVNADLFKNSLRDIRTDINNAPGFLLLLVFKITF